MALGYLHHWGMAYKTLGIEVPFRLPLRNPDTGELMPKEKPLTGKVDWILETHAGLRFISDHKTASRVDDDYWTSLKTDAQILQYELARLQAGFEIEGFLWDVIQKPSMTKTDLTKKNIEEIETGYYCGLPITKPQDVQWKDKETPHLHGLKVLDKCIRDAEKVYFRRVLYRSAQDTLGWWEDQPVIRNRMSRIRNEQDALRNRGNCKNFGQLCPFIPICCGEDPDRTGFRKKKSKPTAEDKEMFSGGLSVSAINEFLSCERKWWYNRVESIEPVNTPTTEALDLGTLVHTGLDIIARATMVDEPITQLVEKEQSE